MRERVNRTDPHPPVIMRFSQDNLGAFKRRRAGALRRQALDAAARGQAGSCMTMCFQGHSRIGDSSFYSGRPSSGKAPSEEISFQERLFRERLFREGGSIAIFGQFSAGASSQEPRVSPTLDSERPGTRKKPETTPASRIRRLRPKAQGPTVRGRSTRCQRTSLRRASFKRASSQRTPRRGA